MSEKTLTHKEKAALAAEVAEMIETRAGDEADIVVAMVVQLLFGRCLKLTA